MRDEQLRHVCQGGDGHQVPPGVIGQAGLEGQDRAPTGAGHEQRAGVWRCLRHRIPGRDGHATGPVLHHMRQAAADRQTLSEPASQPVHGTSRGHGNDDAHGPAGAGQRRADHRRCGGRQAGSPGGTQQGPHGPLEPGLCRRPPSPRGAPCRFAGAQGGRPGWPVSEISHPMDRNVLAAASLQPADRGRVRTLGPAAQGLITDCL